MRRSAVRLSLLILFGLLFAGCRKPLTPHQAQEGVVAVQLLEETAEVCDDLGYQVATEWLAAAKPVLEYEAVKSLGGEISLRVTRPRGKEIALLQEEAAQRVKGLEGRRDPQAGAAQVAYEQTRNHCAIVAYPKADNPNGYDADLRRLRNRRLDALRKLRGLATKLDSTGQAELDEIHLQVDALRQEAAVAFPPPPPAPSPAPDRPVAEGDAWDAAPLTTGEEASRGLSVLSWSFREVGKEMQIEGEVFNLGTVPIEEGRAVIALPDAGSAEKTVEVPLQSKRLGPRESTRFSWHAPLDFRRTECRLSFVDRDGKALEVSGRVLLHQYIERPER